MSYCVKKVIIDFYKDENKGEIEKKYVRFTKNDSLGKIAKKMNLNTYIENSSNSFNKKTNADLFEAVIGAMYLDGGFDEVFKNV